MFIGIDIGGTNIKSALVDDDGTIINSKLSKTPKEDKETFLKELINIIYEYVSQSSELKGLGIGIPGVINSNNELIVSPNLKSLIGINLKKEIRNHFNFDTYIENDSNVAAIAELELGAGIELDDFIYITLGTGVGGTIIHNRKIFKGSTGAAGEIGHLIINSKYFNTEISPFRQGVLEEFASQSFILERMKTVDEKYSDISIRDINILTDEGNKDAINCLSEVGYNVAIGLASAANLLDISNIIIGGGLSNLTQPFYDSLSKNLSQRVLPSLKDRLSIQQAYFNNDAGVIGAAMLCRNEVHTK